MPRANQLTYANFYMKVVFAQLQLKKLKLILLNKLDLNSVIYFSKCYYSCS